MKKNLIILLAILFVTSCKHKEKTYLDEEEQFIASLTNQDTTYVLEMTEAFIKLIQNDMIDNAVNQVTTIYEGQLYPASEEYREQLKNRFLAFPIESYELVRYSFSTQANNDVCYRYYFDDTHSMKLVFNPVKIDGQWYLALKDGTQSSKDLREEDQVHPNSPAPDSVTLCR